jgi:hypothetical protein
MGQMLPGRRVQSAVSLVLGIYFGLAALTDLLGSTLVLPGVAPHGVPRSFQVVTGCAILGLAAALFLPRLSKHAATALVLVWLLRTVWDMTGGPPLTLAWILLLPALVIVRAKTRGEDGAATGR